MKEKIIVFGVSMTSATVLNGMINSNSNQEFEVVGFLDDNPEKLGNEYFGYQVIGKFNDVEDLFNKKLATSFIIGLADHRHMLIRSRIYEKCINLGLKPAVSIHKKCEIVNPELIGKGAFIMPNVYIGVETRIGDHCSIHAGVSILEDCELGSNVMIAGNSFVGGQCTIGDNVYIGPGSIIASGAVIGSNSLVGAGALVLKSIPPSTAAFGHPISTMRENLYYV